MSRFCRIRIISSVHLSDGMTHDAATTYPFEHQNPLRVLRFHTREFIQDWNDCLNGFKTNFQMCDQIRSFAHSTIWCLQPGFASVRRHSFILFQFSLLNHDLCKCWPNIRYHSANSTKLQHNNGLNICMYFKVDTTIQKKFHKWFGWFDISFGFFSPSDPSVFHNCNLSQEILKSIKRLMDYRYCCARKSVYPKCNKMQSNRPQSERQ